MKDEHCCAGRRGRATSAAPLSALGVASTIAALFAPKCPLCIAAYLTLCGLGAGWAGAVAPVVRPAAFAVSFVAFAALVVAVVRRRRWRSTSRAGANDHVAVPSDTKETL
jgi:hypothetical protein